MSHDIDIREGDLFESKAQTLVNTVNCVGVMGKGVALGFRNRFPAMHDDYVQRCARGEVKLGKPYLYRQPNGPWVLNFPTKDHWRSMSRLRDVTAGLEYLKAHYREWGIRSLAVPPLGAGHGGLEWHVVGPTLYRHLSQLDIPVELYVPFGTPHEELQPSFLERLFDPDPVQHAAADPKRIVGPDWVALLTALARIEAEPYGPRVGRTLFQKLAYFATEAGLDLGLHFARSSYGPHAPELRARVSHLMNNGLIVEEQHGRMFEVRLGETYEAAKRAFAKDLGRYEAQIDLLVDLFARMRTKDAEIAATVHYATKELRAAAGRVPNEREVLDAVMDWKQRRDPPFKPNDVAVAIRGLNVLGWIEAKADESLGGDPELELIGA